MRQKLPKQNASVNRRKLKEKSRSDFKKSRDSKLKLQRLNANDKKKRLRNSMLSESLKNRD